MPRRSKLRLRLEPLESRDMMSATVFEHNQIGYFVDHSVAQLERYDIAREQWLSPVVLQNATGLPSAALVDDNAIYAGFDKSLYRYDLDGTNPSRLFTYGFPIDSIHTDGNVLFVMYASGNYAASLDKSTGQVIETTRVWSNVGSSSISVEGNRILGRSGGSNPSHMQVLTYTDDGHFLGSSGNGDPRTFADATRTWMFPGGKKVADNAGNIYAGNLYYLNSFLGPVDDLAFTVNDLPIVLSGNKLTTYSADILPTGDVTLSHPAQEIFVNGSNVIAFSLNAAGDPDNEVMKVPLSAFAPPRVDQPVDPVGLSYTPSRIELMNSDIALILAAEQKSLFRWSPAAQTYLDTIPLRDVPSDMAYSSALNVAYVLYPNGLITKLDVQAKNPVETPFRILPGTQHITAVGSYLFTAMPEPQVLAGLFHLLRPDGQISTYCHAPSEDMSKAYVWNEAAQKLFFFKDSPRVGPYHLLSQGINENGTAYEGVAPGGFARTVEPYDSLYTGFDYPIRVSPSGSIVLLGTGVIHDGATLERTPKALSNSVVDATWLNGELYTIHNVEMGVEFQHWTSSTFENDFSARAEGTAVALKSLSGNRLLGVSLDGQGRPTFTVLDDQLHVVPPPENHAPSLNTAPNPILLPVVEDATNPPGTLASRLLGTAMSDVDPDALQGLAIVAADTSHGMWQYTLDGGRNWLPLGSVSEMSAHLLPSNDQTRLRFIPAKDFNGQSSIQYAAWDRTEGTAGLTLDLSDKRGQNHAFSLTTEVAAITVTPVNDAPVLKASVSPLLNPIYEDATNPGGTPIARLIDGLVTDVDLEAQQGVALVSAPAANGQWQYTVDAGNYWANINNVSESNALLLAKDTQTRVRFVPKPDFAGQVTLYYRAWDQMQGASGDFGPTRGSAFSTGFGKALQQVIAVNDAPVVASGATPAKLNDIYEDATNPGGTPVRNLVAAIRDVDAGAFQGIAVIQAGKAAGTWQFSFDGANWNAMGDVSDLAARLLPADSSARVRFIPNANVNGKVALYYRGWDQTQGAAGDLYNIAGKLGGSNAFSVNFTYGDQTIVAVDDPPRIDSVPFVSGYQLGQPAILLAPAATVTNVDSPHFGGGQLVVHIGAGAQASNVLALSGAVSVANRRVLVDGVDVGALSSDGTGTNDLVISFSDSATTDRVQRLMRALTFKATTGAGATRYVYFTLSDSVGKPSPTVVTRVNVAS